MLHRKLDGNLIRRVICQTQSYNNKIVMGDAIAKIGQAEMLLEREHFMIRVLGLAKLVQLNSLKLAPHLTALASIKKRGQLQMG